VIGRLALRNLTHRPWRSLLLFLGYGLGVGVMIVLLAIGSAMLTQARDEKLVGGGAITVLPEGIDVEVMKTGGVGGLFFSIANARFVYLQLLANPRLAGEVRGVAPQIEGKLAYLRTASGAEHAVRASGEIPSRTRLVGAGPSLAAGAWEDDSLDRRWRDPTPAELRDDIDHFHLPPATLADRETWAEWHYFNVLSSDHRRWVFLTLMVAGDPTSDSGRWGGQVLLTTHEQGGRARRFVATVPSDSVRFSTTRADLAVGGASVTLLADGRYRVHARAREERGRSTAAIDLVVTPAPRAYFPGTSIGDEAFVSGYTVPALRADASGSLCVDGACERYDGAQAYHDHNWGVWRGVTWEWGASRAGRYTILYGHVLAPDTVATSTPLFLFLVDSLGFRALFRPKRIAYADARTITVDGRPVRVPARAEMVDVRGDDTLRVTLDIEDAVGSDTRRAAVERGESGDARAIARPYFIQMKGTARVSGRVGGEAIEGKGAGFFETYR
jgi:hypothetical protein